jgi:hypothetical protein
VPGPEDTPNDAPTERRQRADRRKKPTPMLSRWLVFGRRRGGRRDGEGDFVYVDRPGGWVIAAFVAVIGLSLMDAWYTLDLLRKGATEANPLMRAALQVSDEAFVVIKTAITLGGAGFLCLHKNWPLGRACLVIALLGYSALLVYHLVAQQSLTA